MPNTKVRKRVSKREWESLAPRFRAMTDGKYYRVGSIKNPGMSAVARERGFTEWCRSGTWTSLPRQPVHGAGWGGFRPEVGEQRDRARPRHDLIERAGSCRDMLTPGREICRQSFITRHVHLRVLVMPGDTRIRATARAEWHNVPFASHAYHDGVIVKIARQSETVTWGGNWTPYARSWIASVCLASVARP